MKKLNVCLTIDDDIYEKLQDLKKNHHLNLSALIVSAIREKLEKEKPLAK